MAASAYGILIKYIHISLNTFNIIYVRLKLWHFIYFSIFSELDDKTLSLLSLLQVLFYLIIVYMYTRICVYMHSCVYVCVSLCMCIYVLKFCMIFKNKTNK